MSNGFGTVIVSEPCMLAGIHNGRQRQDWLLLNCLQGVIWFGGRAGGCMLSSLVSRAAHRLCDSQGSTRLWHPGESSSSILPFRNSRTVFAYCPNNGSRTLTRVTAGGHRRCSERIYAARRRVWDMPSGGGKPLTLFTMVVKQWSRTSSFSFGRRMWTVNSRFSGCGRYLRAGHIFSMSSGAAQTTRIRATGTWPSRGILPTGWPITKRR